MSTTDEVLAHHLEAFGNHDVNEILADYDEESVIITDQGVARGLAEIRALFEGLMEEFDQEAVSMEIDRTVIEGDTALLAWHGETPQNEYRFCADTYRIQDGKIRNQTFTADIAPK